MTTAGKDLLTQGAVQDLARDGAEVIQLRGQKGDFGGPPPPELKFAEGDDVQVIYRAREGREEIRAVMYGPTTRAVTQAVCRELQRKPGEIIARPAGDPRPFDKTWIESAPGQPDAGEHLALVIGVTFTQFNIVLGRPVRRIEMVEHRPVVLFDPDGVEASALPSDPDTIPSQGDDE